MRTEKIDEKSNHQVINLALDTLKKSKQAIIFVNAKRSAEKVAEDIADKIKANHDDWEKLSLDALHALSR
ncbi:hypothetical protein HYS48_03630, partial [Candidatus Woesearchaeota archaeon]|nr:hypothetical protein [Candidatus Woesearchaeota archaeon]